jgi:hypothetical protein
MGIFSKKPDVELQRELIKQASNVTKWFGVALRYKKTFPPAGKEGSEIDLTIKQNREAIKRELVNLISAYGLIGCIEGEIGGKRLLPLAQKNSISPLEDAALCCALSFNSINLITRIFYEEYPKYQPLCDMVNNLAKICCTGAAQTIGADLPLEVVRTWPYFSKLFDDTRKSKLILWPDV